MKLLEEIDPELLDQTIRRLLARKRAPDREMAIAHHLAQSGELFEWVDMIAKVPEPVAGLLTAFALGMEVGYELGQREALRAKKSA